MYALDEINVLSFQRSMIIGFFNSEEDNEMRKIVVLMFTVMVMTSVVLSQPEQYVVELMGDQLKGVFITKVPDASQPPSNPLAFRSVDNWCAPISAANIIVFFDQVAAVRGFTDTSAGLSADGLSAYLGYFMATNGEGSAERINSSQGSPGTLNKDIPYGINDFAAWDGSTPPGRSPLHKSVSRWNIDFLETENIGRDVLWEEYCSSIDKGAPVILCFKYWNPIKPVSMTVRSSGNNVPMTFFLWGSPITSTNTLRKENAKIPEEEWNERLGIGHAVTGVGYIVGDPDGNGPLPEGLWIIVHDNWSTTPENVVVPFENLVALFRIMPN